MGSAAVEPRRWRLPRLAATKTKDEVPVLFREPHVERGFRELHQPWTYYILSTFQLHNESMNVWTHLLAFSLMMAKLTEFASQVDFLGDRLTWPLLAGLLCGLALYAFSSGAHCLQSKSELVHYIAFMVDYAGIGLYGLGSVILHLAYCSDPAFYQVVQHFYVPLGGVLAFSICYCCTVAKVMYCRPYPFMRKVWQMAPVGGIYVVLIAPVAHRLWLCWWAGQGCSDSLPHHARQIAWFVASGIFFASDLPQRLKPGACDHFFHSHQLFHACIMVSTLKQMDAVLLDFNGRQDVLRGRPLPTFASAFGPVIVVFLAEVFCIVVFAVRIRNRLHRGKKVD